MSVEYSREGSNVHGADPSEAVLGVWACNVPVWEQHFSVLWACSIPVWERPASGARRKSQPTGGRVVALSLFGVRIATTCQLRLKGQGARSCYCLTRGVILPYIHGNSTLLIGLEVVSSPLAHCAVSDLDLVALGQT